MQSTESGLGLGLRLALVTLGGLPLVPTVRKQWRTELVYRYKRTKTSRITVLNIRKLSLFRLFYPPVPLKNNARAVLGKSPILEWLMRWRVIGGFYCDLYANHCFHLYVYSLMLSLPLVPVVSVLLVRLTVLPNRQKRGIFWPTTPATTSPEWTPMVIYSATWAQNNGHGKYLIKP